MNSGNFNAAGTGFRDSNINTVHSSGNDNGLSAIENGIYCVVQVNKENNLFGYDFLLSSCQKKYIILSQNEWMSHC